MFILLDTHTHVGGTTDAFAKVFYRTLNTGATKLREFAQNDLLKTDVQKKVKCPSVVSFPDKVKIPIASMVGIVDKCIIGVWDHDKLSANDKLLEHSLDLSWLCGLADSETVLVAPDIVKDVESLPANKGFTRDMVQLGFTITLLY